jgi:hypothetical protein
VDAADLRRRVGAILAAEDAEPPDWARVELLSNELLQQLSAEPETECPEIVNHYLDDSDIRSNDGAYAKRQRQEIRRFVTTGEYPESTPIPLWACAVVLAVALGLVIWLLW